MLPTCPDLEIYIGLQWNIPILSESTPGKICLRIGQTGCLVSFAQPLVLGVGDHSVGSYVVAASMSATMSMDLPVVAKMLR